jgi:hypothetical protein
MASKLVSVLILSPLVLHHQSTISCFQPDKKPVLPFQRFLPPICCQPIAQHDKFLSKQDL